jgi:nucleoside-diphosphate-sugar epimerase
MGVAKRRALVVGSTGIAGHSVSKHLMSRGWTTFGLSRSGAPGDGVTPVKADLLNPATLRDAVQGLRPDAVFITAWMRQPTEAQNVEVNGAIVGNILSALESQDSVRHVSLLTGLKHYLGPFDAYGLGVMAETPFHESSDRLPGENFYYEQEDLLFAAAKKQKFTWSVHRAHTMFGFATGNAMNIVLTLSVYAALCKELGQPFVFPGSEEQWNSLTDVTDADLVAEQMVWATTDARGHNEAFNITNGDVFRWRSLWPRIADYFGLEPVGYRDQIKALEHRMTGMDEVWERIASREGLVEPDISRLASWWHTDGDLGRAIECVTDMTKSRQHGFHGFRSTPQSFFDTVSQYRDAGILPAQATAR